MQYAGSANSTARLDSKVVNVNAFNELEVPSIISHSCPASNDICTCVNNTVACIPTGLTNLVDFQGHVLEDSFFGTVANNPVIGQFWAAGLNQEWVFVAQPSTPGTYTIVNGIDDEQLSLSFAGSGVPAELRQFPQAAAAIQTAQALAFTIANTAVIQDAVYGFALNPTESSGNEFYILRKARRAGQAVSGFCGGADGEESHQKKKPPTATIYLRRAG
ncbi:hypothetical protein B0H13DRAFT_1870734 [Mycena leptocephala]|nr:hypothetical protein B0H13DRAFT_1870734 [Mycena leptocephala]